MVDRDLIRTIVKSIRQADSKQTHAYDTTAVVRRIENGTAWVHIAGGVDETPVKLTISASVGDTVQVRVSGGRAFLVGNATAPPTDDTTAVRVNNRLTATNRIVKKVSQMASEAFKIASNTRQYFWFTEEGTDTGAHIAEVPREEFEDDPTNAGGNLLANSNGVAIRDGVTEVATFSADGVAFGDEDGVKAVLAYDSDADQEHLLCERVAMMGRKETLDTSAQSANWASAQASIGNLATAENSNMTVYSPASGGNSAVLHSESHLQADLSGAGGKKAGVYATSTISDYGGTPSAVSILTLIGDMILLNVNNVGQKLVVKDTFSALNQSSNTYYYQKVFDIAKTGYTPIAFNAYTNHADSAACMVNAGTVTVMSRANTISGLNVYLDVTYVRNELI